MGENSKIEWCEHTFNPWHGCTKVSTGPRGACEKCYAASLAARYGWGRFGGPGDGVGYRTRTGPANWKKPLAWDRAAAKAGTRPFVFCASLADVFDNQVEPQWRRDLFDLIRATPALVWLLLTKRPQNIERLFGEAMLDPPDGGSGYPWPANAAIGCTVVTQEEADRDVPALLQAKAALKPAFAFVSMEPLMGPVDLTRVDDGAAHREVPEDEWGCLDDEDSPPALWWDALTGERSIMHGGATGDWRRYDASLDWVIAGGESGPGARPSHPDWFRDLRDQCATARTPFLFKQWGEWTPGENAGPVTGPQTGAYFDDDGAWSLSQFTRRAAEDLHTDDEPDVWRVGKKAAGRLLDGVLHDARPSAA